MNVIFSAPVEFAFVSQAAIIAENERSKFFAVESGNRSKYLTNALHKLCKTIFIHTFGRHLKNSSNIVKQMFSAVLPWTSNSKGGCWVNVDGVFMLFHFSALLLLIASKYAGNWPKQFWSDMARRDYSSMILARYDWSKREKFTVNYFGPRYILFITALKRLCKRNTWPRYTKKVIIHTCFYRTSPKRVNVNSQYAVILLLGIYI